MAVNLQPREAQCLARLDLRFVNGFDAGADDLGGIGGEIDRHADQGSRHRADPETEPRQAEIDNEELHEKRRVADDLDIGIDENAADARFHRAYRRKDNAGGTTKDDRRHGKLDRHPDAGQNFILVLGDDAKLEGVGHLRSPLENGTGQTLPGEPIERQIRRMAAAAWAVRST